MRGAHLHTCAVSGDSVAVVHSLAFVQLLLQKDGVLIIVAQELVECSPALAEASVHTSLSSFALARKEHERECGVKDSPDAAPQGKLPPPSSAGDRMQGAAPLLIVPALGLHRGL